MAQRNLYQTWDSHTHTHTHTHTHRVLVYVAVTVFDLKEQIKDTKLILRYYEAINTLVLALNWLSTQFVSFIIVCLHKHYLPVCVFTH